MNKNNFSQDAFQRMPLVGIARHLSLDDMKNIMPLFVQSGLTTIEITMNSEGAPAIIEYIRRHFPSVNTGAGTVCTGKDLSKALDAGAQFIVTPVIVKKIIRRCVKLKLPVFPGAFTPTEIFTAWELGATMVKVYPAKTLGDGYIKDIKAPLNHIKLLPTGGITLEDIAPFKKAGADGFGVGSPLFVKKMIDGKNWDALLLHFQHFVAAMQSN